LVDCVVLILLPAFRKISKKLHPDKCKLAHDHNAVCGPHFTQYTTAVEKLKGGRYAFFNPGNNDPHDPNDEDYNPEDDIIDDDDDDDDEDDENAGGAGNDDGFAAGGDEAEEDNSHNHEDDGDKSQSQETKRQKTEEPLPAYEILDAYKIPIQAEGKGLHEVRRLQVEAYLKRFIQYQSAAINDITPTIVRYHHYVSNSLDIKYAGIHLVGSSGIGKNRSYCCYCCC
jgi:curved DNA-binding protein CbpA